MSAVQRQTKLIVDSTWAFPADLRAPLLETVSLPSSPDRTISASLSGPKVVEVDPESGLALHLDERGNLSVRGHFRGPGMSLSQQLVNTLLNDTDRLKLDAEPTWDGWFLRSENGRLVEISRKELLPLSIAWCLGLVGEPAGRASDGYDVQLVPSDAKPIANLSIKLLPSGSPLLKPASNEGRAKYGALTYSIRDNDDGAVLLIPFPSVRPEHVRSVIQRVIDGGGRAEGIVLLPAELLALAGYGLAENDGRVINLPGDLDRGLRFRAAVALYRSPAFIDALADLPEEVVEAMRRNGLCAVIGGIHSSLCIADALNPAHPHALQGEARVKLGKFLRGTPVRPIRRSKALIAQLLPESEQSSS